MTGIPRFCFVLFCFSKQGAGKPEEVRAGLEQEKAAPLDGVFLGGGSKQLLYL